jgi:hypothetical protein
MAPVGLQSAGEAQVCVVTHPVWLALQAWSCAPLQRVCPALQTGAEQVPLLALHSPAVTQVCVVTQRRRTQL